MYGRLKAIGSARLGTSALILLATVESEQNVAQMLDQIAARVTAYVVAPQESLRAASTSTLPEFWTLGQCVDSFRS